MKSNFLQRAITGIIFVAVLIGCIVGGAVSFGILFAIISALAINEFCNLVNHVEGIQVNKENPLNNWAYAMLSQMYIALPFALLNVLAFHSDETASLSQYNAILPLSIFIFNWVNDTGAYCTGMLFGKHKLFERISPKKSWEGSIGGGVFCILASFLLSHFFPFMSTGVWIGLALTVVVFGTWGDLTESLLKRRLGIKDSGNILPGHGGMLDRFDSAILAIPAAVVYLYVVSLF